jgi:23S rRNA pseudouridine1911/1915/1917 synthase
MLNRGHAYTTTISSKDHGRTLLSHLASLYPHSTPQAWQQRLNNREVTKRKYGGKRSVYPHIRRLR